MSQASQASQAEPHFATGTNYAFVDKLLEYGESHEAQVGDRVRDEDEEFEGVITSKTDDLIVVRADTGETHEISADAYLYIEDSPLIAGIWDAQLRAPDPDGVAYSDVSVPEPLRLRLNAQLQRLIDDEPADFHPGSGDRVRDLVHPSLYPYVTGTSVSDAVLTVRENPDYDRWGRAFESSIYQWLPTPFQIANDGSTSIAGYINNLDQTKYAALYTDLSELFSCALPLIEGVLGYIQETTFWTEECKEIDHEGELPEVTRNAAPKPGPSPLLMRGRELQVIPKIVEYRIDASSAHEGVWHVEGMSHEHIVAACIYIVDRDDALFGGELRFKRAYTVEEAGKLFWNVDQCRPLPIERMVEEGVIPLGSVATPRGRIIVFPNSHIHKLSALEWQGLTEEGRRRVIVFWIVDPEVQIPSTREIAPQQERFSRDEALAMRLALMEERKRHKQTLNVRTVSLCEH